MSRVYCRTWGQGCEERGGKWIKTSKKRVTFSYSLKGPLFRVRLLHQKKALVTLLSNWYGLGYHISKKSTNINDQY